MTCACGPKLDALIARVDALARALPPQPLVTARDAAKRLAVSEQTVRRMIRDGRLPVVRIGRAVRVSLRGL